MAPATPRENPQEGSPGSSPHAAAGADDLAADKNSSDSNFSCNSTTADNNDTKNNTGNISCSDPSAPSPSTSSHRAPNIAATNLPMSAASSPQRQWQRRALRRALARGISARNQYLDSYHMPPTPSSPIKGNAPRGSGQAFLHIYDLKGVAGLNDTVISMGLGVYHVGIEVYGVEWSYGYFDSPNLVSGVYPFHPKKCPIGTYRESQPLGPVRVHSAADAWRLLEALATEWLGHEYHPLKYNCLDFCRELSRLLHLEEMPTWVGRLATVADTLLTPLLDSFQVRLVPRIDAEEAERPEAALPGANNSERGDEDEEEDECEASNCSLPSTSDSVGRADASLLAARLSAETTVALDFECRYHWAWKKMQVEEGRLRRENLP